MDRINRNAGFTLIEILVVVIIIGVVLGLTSLNFNRNLDSLAHNEAKRYARVLGYTKEYSAYTGRVLSLRLDAQTNTYYFLYVDPVKHVWNRLTDKTGNKLLSPHKINQRVLVKISSPEDDNSKQTLGDIAQTGRDEPAGNTQIALITPFSDFQPSDLILSGETRDYVVTTDEFDDVAIETR